jgi:hypothetical protein
MMENENKTVNNEVKENESMFGKAFGKAKELGNKGMSMVKKGVEKVKDDPMEAAYVGMCAAVAGAVAVLTAVSVGDVKKQNRKEYIPETNSRVVLKHQLTIDEQKELAWRMGNGQDKLSALETMGLVSKKQ